MAGFHSLTKAITAYPRIGWARRRSSPEVTREPYKTYAENASSVQRCRLAEGEREAR